MTEPTIHTSPPEQESLPRVDLRTFSFSPSIYPGMIRPAGSGIAPGSLVRVYDRNGDPFGCGFYNRRARAPLRMFHHGPDTVGEDFLDQLVERAIELRRQYVKADEATTAWRVVFSDADQLPGLTVDKFGDTLSIEITTLAAWQRLPRWLPLLHKACGTHRHHVACDPAIASMEGIKGAPPPSPPAASARFVEHGIRYEARFLDGHKTGFFCDQRENRLRLARWVGGRPMLDLCCYTGGFSLAAKLIGGSNDVTAVDLDEKAIAQARRNANLNQTRLDLVHADAFTWLRQMIQNGRSWPVVVLDPPKFVFHRDDLDDARRKYEDLNRLAISVLDPGGLFVTCSCSGLLSPHLFEQSVVRAAHRARRRLRILDSTGAGPDHPVASNSPETRYLKVIWAQA